MCWLCLGPSSCKPSRKHNFLSSTADSSFPDREFYQLPKNSNECYPWNIRVEAESHWSSRHRRLQGFPDSSWNTGSRRGQILPVSFAALGKLLVQSVFPSGGSHPVQTHLVLIAGWFICARGLSSIPLPSGMGAEHARAGTSLCPQASNSAEQAKCSQLAQPLQKRGGGKHSKSWAKQGFLTEFLNFWSPKPSPNSPQGLRADGTAPDCSCSQTNLLCIFSTISYQNTALIQGGSHKT